MNIDSLAKTAQRAVGTDKSPSAAVADAVRGHGLNFEKISRVCTKVNIALLEKDKSKAYTKESGGRLWSQRWETAKPEVVAQMIGMSAPDTPLRRKQSAAQAQEQSWNDLIPTRTSPAINVRAKQSAPVALEHSGQYGQDIDKVLQLQDMVSSAREAYKLSLQKLSEAEMARDGADAYLQAVGLDALENEALSLGEVLTIVKQSCTNHNAVVRAADHWMRELNVDPNALLGHSVDEHGQLNDALIKASRAMMRVNTDALADGMTGQLIINPGHPLVKASRAAAACADEHEIALRTAAQLEKMVEDWSSSAHHVLFSPVSDI